MNRDFLIYISTLIAGFALLIAGALSSPTFNEQMSYIEGIGMLISLIFVFSVVYVAAHLGFRSFSLFLALFIAMAISLYGIYAGFLVVIMTYIVWGFVFAIEILLVHNDSSSAKKWFREHYTTKTFDREFKIFYPMIWIFYFFWEYLPAFFYKDRDKDFYPSTVRDEIKELLG